MNVSRTFLIALGACFINGAILGVAGAPGWAGYATSFVIMGAFLLAEREVGRRIRLAERLMRQQANLIHNAQRVGEIAAEQRRSAAALSGIAASSARGVVR